jgi:transposase-like protein
VACKTRGRPQPGSKRKRYSVEFKLKAVKLYTEEGYSTEMVTHELGIGKNTLSIWTKRYREEGAAGLENRAPVPVSRRQIDPADQRRPDDAYGLDGAALY